MTPYDAALIVMARTNNPALMGPVWPGHRSGLGPVAREILGQVHRREIWRDWHGDYVIPNGRFGTPWIRAFLAAELVRHEHGINEHGRMVLGIVLTDLGQTVIDGTFVAKEPDLLDLVAGGV